MKHRNLISIIGALIGISLVVLVLDQYSKAWIVKYMLGSFHVGPVFDAPVFIEPRYVTSFLDLVLVGNKGISFSLLTSHHEAVRYGLAMLSLLIVILLWGWFFYNKKLDGPRGGVVLVAVGMITGGALGNIVDRLLHGAVIDFLHFHWNEWYWPAFNVADSMICSGVVLILICGFKSDTKNADNKIAN